MMYIKLFYSALLSKIKLTFSFFFFFLKREYFAYITKKMMWNHAIELTYKVFFVCLYPAWLFFSSIIYMFVLEFYLVNRYSSFISQISTIFFQLFRTLYIRLGVTYTEFANKNVKYQYSFFGYICLWVVTGFTIWLLFL